MARPKTVLAAVPKRKFVEIDDDFIAKLITLTESEMEILELMVEDITYEEIAACRNCSVNTVKTHVKSIYRKLKVRNIAEAVRKYLREVPKPEIIKVIPSSSIKPTKK